MVGAFTMMYNMLSLQDQKLVNIVCFAFMYNINVPLKAITIQQILI